ncbi:MAG TPA: TIM barrel protein [Armatimonadota bacterium]|nr:TIM barrel protein [Armatimonadota bacterium]
MAPIRQSLSWWCFAREGIDPVELIKTAADIGYASIEMGSEEHYDLIHECGMDVAITMGHGTLVDGLNKPENADRIEAELLENIEMAVAAKIPSLICFSGNREGMADDVGASNCADTLKRVAKAAEDAGILLCIELLNSKVDHADYMCDRTEWGVEVCKMVGSPNVKLLYDIYHMQIMEGDLIRTIGDNIDYIGHFHTAGNPGRNDMDETQEIYYPPVAKRIAETDYAGFVGHEFIPKGDVFEAIRAAYETWNV